MTQVPPSADVEKMPDPKAFQKWVDAYPRGALAIDLAKALRECVRATETHNRKSTLVLKVDISPGEGFGNSLTIEADVQAKPCRPKPIKTTWYPTPQGGLQRNDPNQRTIDEEINNQ